MDIFYTFNDWIRLLILVSGVFIGGFTVGLAKKKWQEVIGGITLLCSIIIPILIEARMWWVRSHSMYNSDWDIIRDCLDSTSLQPEHILFALYIVLAALWIICLTQIIRLILLRKKV